MSKPIRILKKNNIIETLNLRISVAYTEAHTDTAGETFPY